LAASIKKHFGENARIKPGKSGQFDVIADGDLIYSKASTGRFPVDNEVEDMLAKRG
jgi:predicted Rdx family selenoprotein